MQYKLFAKRFLRLFIVPVRGEDYMRVIVTSNTPEVIKSFSKSLDDVGARLLAHCLISKPPGEFPATLQDVSDGTQETHETEVCEYLTTEDQSPSSEPQSISKSLIFRRSDSHTTSSSLLEGKCLETATTCEQIETKPGSSGVPYYDPPSYDSVMVSSRDGSAHNPMDPAPSVPPLSAVQPTTHPKDDALPSAPTLSSAYLQKGSLTSTGSQGFDSMFAHTEDASNQPVLKPLPVLVRQSSAQDASADFGSHLFPHQKRTVMDA